MIGQCQMRTQSCKMQVNMHFVDTKFHSTRVAFAHNFLHDPGTNGKSADGATLDQGQGGAGSVLTTSTGPKTGAGTGSDTGTGTRPAKAGSGAGTDAGAATGAGTSKGSGA
jgi:hypothetical protein